MTHEDKQCVDIACETQDHSFVVFFEPRVYICPSISVNPGPSFLRRTFSSDVQTQVAAQDEPHCFSIESYLRVEMKARA